MGYKKAVILGNGESRRNLDIPTDCDVWGCNYIYREQISIDVLVATDVFAQHDIYVDGWANDNRCIFLDWVPVPSAGIQPPETLAGNGFEVVYNEYTEHGVVISGWKNDLFYTYLNETDRVEHIPMRDIPHRFSSGSLAMWQAALEGYTEIWLAGFGDDAHYYAGRKTESGKQRFEKEREYIINKYSNIRWRYTYEFD